MTDAIPASIACPRRWDQTAPAGARAGLIQPSDAGLHALRQIVCHLLIRHYREPIAYGAGWTDPRTPTARGRDRTPRAAPPGRDHRRRAATSARPPRPAPRD